MNGFPTREQVERIKARYPAGTRIRLDYMDDHYAPISPGTEGVVDHVDDIGTLHCKFENGRGLVAGYADYYNYERRMWDRNRMTPVEYEQYLLNMTENDFGEYLLCEEEKYQRMKVKAAKLAIERAKSLGV